MCHQLRVFFLSLVLAVTASSDDSGSTVPATTGAFLARKGSEGKEGLEIVMRVKNDAAQRIHLTSCFENVTAITLDPGMTKTLDPDITKLLMLFDLSSRSSGRSGMWVVPDGAHLNCEEGPFDFFYVSIAATEAAEAQAAAATASTDVETVQERLEAFVGFGLEGGDEDETLLQPEDGDNHEAADEKKENNNDVSADDGSDASASTSQIQGGEGDPDLATKLEAPNKEPLNLNGVTGVILSSTKDCIACTQGFCKADCPVAASSTGLDLIIKGTSSLSPQDLPYAKLGSRTCWGRDGYCQPRGGWGERWYNTGRPRSWHVHPFRHR